MIPNFYSEEKNKQLKSISPFTRKFDKCCNDIEEKEEELKRLKLAKDNLLRNIYDPMFKILFDIFGTELAELILTYNPQKWCKECHSYGRLDYHYFNGCTGDPDCDEYNYTWVTLGPVFLIPRAFLISFDFSKMLETDVKAIKNMGCLGVDRIFCNDKLVYHAPFNVPPGAVIKFFRSNESSYNEDKTTLFYIKK